MIYSIYIPRKKVCRWLEICIGSGFFVSAVPHLPKSILVYSIRQRELLGSRTAVHSYSSMFYSIVKVWKWPNNRRKGLPYILKRSVNDDQLSITNGQQLTVCRCSLNTYVESSNSAYFSMFFYLYVPKIRHIILVSYKTFSSAWKLWDSEFQLF